jgi:ABC-type multidrug transport system ATPase subunit
VLWDDLTVEEHLLFYARLKGVPPELEEAAVASALDDVRLKDHKTKLIK